MADGCGAEFNRESLLLGHGDCREKYCVVRKTKTCQVMSDRLSLSSSHLHSMYVLLPCYRLLDLDYIRFPWLIQVSFGFQAPNEICRMSSHSAVAL